MSEFKSAGRLIGEGLGTVIGEPIKYVGTKLYSTLLSEIGEGIKKTSSATGETAGTFAGGAYNTAAGFIRNDKHQKQEGIEALVNSTSRTVKGMDQAIVQTWSQGEDVYKGLIENDEERLIRGTKGIVKNVAISAFTVSTFELIDGIDGMNEKVQSVEPDLNEIQTVQYKDSFQYEIKDEETPKQLDEYNKHIASNSQQIETINEKLEGESHPETDIPFVRATVHLPNGEIVSAVYPDFDEEYSVTISETTYLSSDVLQFDVANEQLAYKIQEDIDLREQFNPEQILQIQAGETPDGYVWHHHQEPGRLELVDEAVHAQTGHSGGRALWAGGSEYR